MLLFMSLASSSYSFMKYSAQDGVSVWSNYYYTNIYVLGGASALRSGLLAYFLVHYGVFRIYSAELSPAAGLAGAAETHIF
jgi:hypothetical protein